MTKADTRRFFVLGTLVCAALFIGITVHSHRTVVLRQHSRTMTDEVRRGLAVWNGANCENCHTLLGEGAYFAPDLTEIVAQRGEAYLKAFMADPSAFYSQEEDGRLMPTLGLSEQEISDVIAFLAWVDGIDTQGWPPRPIRVTGVPTSMPGREAPTSRATGEAGDPVSHGRRVFDRAGCGACHALEPGASQVGPSLAGVARRAEERVASTDYAGQAQDAAGYVRESILRPSAHIAGPAPRHATPQGVSYMPATYDSTLDPQELDALVAYLLTLQ